MSPQKRGELLMSWVKSSLCDYRDACILFKGIIAVANTSAAATVASNANKKGNN